MRTSFLSLLLVVASLASWPSRVYSQIIGLPELKGKYLVCPNNKGIPVDFWVDLYVRDGFNPLSPKFFNGSWDYNTLSSRERVAQLQGLSSQVIVTTSTEGPSSGVIIALKKKILVNSSHTTSSYQATHIQPVLNPINDGINGWTYEHSDSTGKRLVINRRYGSGDVITDSQGRDFGVGGGSPSILFYCTDNAVVLRAVTDLHPSGATDSYGRGVVAPVLLWIVNASIESSQPNSAYGYSF